jgi:hypothetical protein
VIKLWRVTNGFWGNDEICCFVLAETEERAKTLASFKLKGSRHAECSDLFWTRLTASVFLDNFDKEWTSEVIGE